MMKYVLLTTSRNLEGSAAVLGTPGKEGLLLMSLLLASDVNFKDAGISMTSGKEGGKV